MNVMKCKKAVAAWLAAALLSWFGTERSVGHRSTRLLSEAVERGNVQELERLLGIVGPGYWRYRIEDRLEELRVTPG